MQPQNNKIIDWLLEDNNPAVKYRTQTELLGITADKTSVIERVNSFIPQNWKKQKVYGIYIILLPLRNADCHIKI
jgi:hypothetical protein